MKPQRITVRYEGRVQGIGFRYTAVSLAQELAVTGRVKNEFDGSVSLVAEGAEDVLMELLSAIRRSHLGRHLTREQVRRSTATGEFKGFGVQH
jgi:acylphosphatase